MASTPKTRKTASGKKPAAAKTTAKKSAPKKAAPKKAAPKKAAPTKPAPKKAAATKSASKKTAPKKTSAKKTFTTKTGAKKTTAKAAPKKSAPRKSAARKPTAGARRPARKGARLLDATGMVVPGVPAVAPPVPPGAATEVRASSAPHAGPVVTSRTAPHSGTPEDGAWLRGGPKVWPAVAIALVLGIASLFAVQVIGSGDHGVRKAEIARAAEEARVKAETLARREAEEAAAQAAAAETARWEREAAALKQAPPASGSETGMQLGTSTGTATDGVDTITRQSATPGKKSGSGAGSGADAKLPPQTSAIRNRTIRDVRYTTVRKGFTDANGRACRTIRTTFSYSDGASDSHNLDYCRNPTGQWLATKRDE